jgi:transketolase
VAEIRRRRMQNNHYHCPDASMMQELKDIANKIRIHSIRSTNAANSGHPTSSCSAAEIMSVLFFNTMRYDPSKPRDPNSDRFVMSKGHACPALYGAWVETGHVTAEEMMKLRRIDSDIEGHPTPRLDFIDVGTGSLGQGLSCAAGMAYTGKYFDKASYRVYCLIGDGESAEGSIWEALAFASHYKLDNLVAIFDVNRLGQSEPTALQHHTEVYQKRLEAFGWETHVVDGHDVEKLCKVLHTAATTSGKPTAIVAKTFKGRGIVGIEDQDNWHGKPLGDKADKAIEQITSLIKNPDHHKIVPQSPVKDAPVLNVDFTKISLSEPPAYKLGEKVATRLAYGTALVKIGTNCDRVVALDGDVKNSTYSEKFKKSFPDRFVECFIAEQNMVSVAIGCGTRHRTIPFCSTFATFYTRAFDQLRMGAISMANIKCCGSHAGCSIGEDGPSQMGLEDIALFRTLPGSTVFYPSDAVSTERAVELAARTEGICFIRTTRANTPVYYSNDERFEVGHGKVVKHSANDKVLIIGAGITLVEAIKAAETLAQSGIQACVVDPFTIKPIDKKLLIEHAIRVGGKVVTVEDHYPEGGIGEAVASALSDTPNVSIKRLAVNALPRSGTPEGLMERFGISSGHIVAAVQEILKTK